MLLNRSEQFVAFGYEAEQIYNDSKTNNTSHESDKIGSDDDDVTDSDCEADDVGTSKEKSYNVEDLMLFKHFKMMLMKSKVNLYDIQHKR